MTLNKRRQFSPSEFYRLRRPEYFSDSEIIYESKLQREHLAFELHQISTNQKQDDFETLCRKLAEIFVSPNLIPQVGPTGGGDGKTDSETYPVSKSISDKWYIPENGWDNNEKWAFAISAKQTWKSKAKSDIKKIVETGRGYTRAYFITNQTPSSKKKKDAQDEFIKEFGIDVIIFDSEWILEKIYSNNLINLAVDALNLSNSYKTEDTALGPNDNRRSEKLDELENNIKNPNRYLEYDFQLVEDALESAIIARMLERDRGEIEGKFDRAIRFCKKVNQNKQWIRIHYQRAWTYLNWYDDYALFIDEFKNFKSFIPGSSTIAEVELYVNLVNLLRGVSTSGRCNLLEYGLELQDELVDLRSVLMKYKDDVDKPSSSLIAKTYLTLQGLMDALMVGSNTGQYLLDLSENIAASLGFMDYPFDVFKLVIEELGEIFIEKAEYDLLIDRIALMSEKRSSELTAGEIFLKRGLQKLEANRFKEAIIYFGRAVFKLAKEETHDAMYISLHGLSQAYKALGLIWASNNCLVAACSISFKSWYEDGVFNKRMYDCVRELAANELFIGRIPIFLVWHELFKVIVRQIDIPVKEGEVPEEELLDTCCSVRLLNTDSNSDLFLQTLPDIFESQELWFTKVSALYKLGYTELVSKEYGDQNLSDEELHSNFEIAANQPFVEQMLYETNYLSSTKISISTSILGCRINMHFEKDIDMLLSAEMILAFLESFFSTSLTDVYPTSEIIEIHIKKNVEVDGLKLIQNDERHSYYIEINPLLISNRSRDTILKELLKLIGHLITENYFIKNPKQYLKNLFKNEEVNERLSLIFEHLNFVKNILGDVPKVFLEDWTDREHLKEYPKTRTTPLKFNKEIISEKKSSKHDKPDMNSIGHNQRTTLSVIDVNLWDDAKWDGFGVFADMQGLGTFLIFKNGEAGKRIFDEWVKRVGKEDKENLIKISIIKGINIDHPSWYRVLISPNFDLVEKKPNNFIFTVFRFHEMQPENSTNLDTLEKMFEKMKRYRLCPGGTQRGGKEVQPFVDRAIYKTSLSIVNAWEISENDVEKVVLKKTDSVIIPKSEKNAPIITTLKTLEQ